MSNPKNRLEPIAVKDLVQDGWRITKKGALSFQITALVYGILASVFSNNIIVSSLLLSIVIAATTAIAFLVDTDQPVRVLAILRFLRQTWASVLLYAGVALILPLAAIPIAMSTVASDALIEDIVQSALSWPGDLSGNMSLISLVGMWLVLLPAYWLAGDIFRLWCLFGQHLRQEPGFLTAIRRARADAVRIRPFLSRLLAIAMPLSMLAVVASFLVPMLVLLVYFLFLFLAIFTGVLACVFYRLCHPCLYQADTRKTEGEG